MRQKLQKSKGYAESSEFLPALGLFISKKKSVATSSLDYQKKLYLNIEQFKNHKTYVNKHRKSSMHQQQSCSYML